MSASLFLASILNGPGDFVACDVLLNEVLASVNVSGMVYQIHGEQLPTFIV